MESKDAYIYEIQIQERLSNQWSEWLEGMHLSYSSQDETILTGVLADQAALYSVLLKIHNLGLTLISMRRMKRNDRSVQ